MIFFSIWYRSTISEKKKGWSQVSNDMTLWVYLLNCTDPTLCEREMFFSFSSIILSAGTVTEGTKDFFALFGFKVQRQILRVITPKFCKTVSSLQATSSSSVTLAFWNMNGRSLLYLAKEVSFALVLVIFSQTSYSRMKLAPPNKPFLCCWVRWYLERRHLLHHKRYLPP